MTSIVVSVLDRSADATIFNMTLTVVGFCVWLLVVQIRSLSTILTRSRYHVIFAPMISTAVVLCMSLITGVYSSRVGFVVFFLLWSGWLTACRLVRQQYLPQLRILTLGSSAYVAEIQALPNVDVVTMQSPPEGFDDIDVVALDPVAHRGEDWLRWLMHADMAGVKLIAAPLVVEALTRQLPLEALHGRWAHHLFVDKRTTIDWKRFMDVVVVVMFSPVLLLLFGFVALAVYIDDGGPVLFWQARIGRDRRPFMIAKVRSMRVDAEANGAAFAAQDDPRITRVGAFIRRYRLDEVPQFWNVLVGEMSIVGPRPEQVDFSEGFERRFPLYSLRYKQRPGITGWAQVMAGYAADDDESYLKLRHDLYYVRHVSLLFDIAIMFRTIGVIATGFGAR